MAQRYSLTEGSLRTILKGGKVVDPIMQVLGSKKIASSNAGKERFRLLISDGKNLISFAMVNTEINAKVSTGELAANTIIKVHEYVTSIINNAGKGDKRVLVILDMEILVPGNEVDKIGNPIALADNEFDLDSLVSATPTSAMATNGNSSGKPYMKPYGDTVSARQNSGDLNISLQDQLTHPITSLSPYQNKWVIKARVNNKSQIRTWSNSRGEGQLFSIDLGDESGEIRCTIFKELVDKYFSLMEVDKVYYISKCQLKVANKQFTNIKNDYEMTFTNDTVVQECMEADTSIPQVHYDFIKIDKIAHIESDTIIDVIGVCKTTSDLQTIQARATGRELKKRELTLIDQSNTGIALTLWGKDAEEFDGSTQPVVLIKGAKVREFGGGKTVSMQINSIMKINPDLPESHGLRGWFDNGGMQNVVTNISAKSLVGGLQTPWMSFKEAQDQGLGNAEKGDYYQVKATVLLFRPENCMYKACPTEDCNKKVIDQENGMYRCEKCNREYPNFRYRLLGLMNVGDWSGNQWVTVFASEAEKVLGMSSQDVGEAIEHDPDALARITDKANFQQFILKCRAKSETYNDESRLKTVALKVDSVKYHEYNAQLISRIRDLNN